MSGIYEDRAGATPLEPDDQEGLIPTWIATQADLNHAEQRNIALAHVWVSGRSWSVEDVDRRWLQELHRRMLGDVFRWAGSFRRRDTNIGLPWGQVQTAVEALTLDLVEQVQDGAWSPDEIAVRFHHQLVWIHPFRNGNGRHARLAADVVVTILGRHPFEWGASGDLTDEGPARHDYLAALKSADGLDYAPLLAFARTPPGTEPPA